MEVQSCFEGMFLFPFQCYLSCRSWTTVSSLFMSKYLVAHKVSSKVKSVLFSLCACCTGQQNSWAQANESYLKTRDARGSFVDVGRHHHYLCYVDDHNICIMPCRICRLYLCIRKWNHYCIACIVMRIYWINFLEETCLFGFANCFQLAGFFCHTIWNCSFSRLTGCW